MDTKKCWIVIVDDDVVSLKNARVLLSGEDLKISVLRSGKELLTFIQKNQPDMILLDVMMPEMDGFETYSKLREYEDVEGRSHTHVVFLTGEEDANMEQKGLMIGASDYIRKPINRDVLLRRVYNIIENVEVIENLTEEATIDKLTGFYNKAYAEEKMNEVCKENIGLLMVLDIDNFKLINDLYGHDMGDNVLISFADIVRHNCRAKDILCRIGGDEFLVFFTDTEDSNVGYSFTSRINDQLIDKCIALMGDGFEVPIGVSVGCIVVSKKGEYSDYFQHADKALYQVKQNGKHGFQLYDTGYSANVTGFDPKTELKKMMTLCNERGKAESAMMLNRDAFVYVYRYLDRFTRRNNKETAKIIIYLSPVGEVDEEEYMDALSVFGNILQNSFRKNDVITKSRNNCYFLLLSEYSNNDQEIAMKRVQDKWKDTEYYEKFKIGYEAIYGDNEI